MAALEGVRKRERFAPEVQRRMRLGEALDESRRMCHARQGKFPVSTSPSPTALPAGLRVARPGALAVAFPSAEDRLGSLSALMRIASEDLEKVKVLLGTAET